MRETIEIPPAPDGVNEAAVSFWEQVHKVTPLSDHERTVLTQICKALTRIAELEAAWESDGRYTINGVQGSTVIHPIFTEIRAQQNIIDKLYKTLNLHNIIDESSDAKGAVVADPNVIALIERAQKRKAN
jgi:hypothetical protein